MALQAYGAARGFDARMAKLGDIIRGELADRGIEETICRVLRLGSAAAARLCARALLPATPRWYP